MIDLFEELKIRGYISQVTDEQKIKELLKDKITFYAGFDPTASSLHVGHLLQLIVISRLQRAGHRPVILIGGGTAMVGDPSGKTDMRKILTKDEIDKNSESFKIQMKKFVNFNSNESLLVNNADWLCNLNYISFLREIGVHFTVNRMLTAECFKSRMEKGLTFIEFNYMLMQAYDFLMLFRKHNCIMQIGGDDQWSNILAGIDLIRRVEKKETYGMTFTLLTTSDGKKMGKTEKGAVWLDPVLTPPYDFYQYWRNVDDKDVERLLLLLTFLPIDRIKELGKLKDEKINEAKKILAFEVTKLVHGEKEAKRVHEVSEAIFEKNKPVESAPEINLPPSERITEFLIAGGACSSKSQAKRLIEGGAVFVNDSKVLNPYSVLNDFSVNKDNVWIIKCGRRHRWIIKKSP